MPRPRGIIATPPHKPRKNFPLYAHANGSWVCKVGGRRRAFGGWKNDPKGEAAYLNWKVFDDARREGREAPQVKAGFVTCRDVVNSLLADRKAKLDAGNLDRGSYADYLNACRSFLRIVGPDKSPYDLMPVDFAAAVMKWGETRGAHALGRWVQLVRTAFNHAGPDGIGLIDRPPRYGGQFAKPAAKLKRKAIREAEAESGKRVFTPAEIRLMLDKASPTLKACILLGLNCGFLAIDCARLTAAEVDLERGWLDLTRQKTETHRAAALWPETVKALKAAAKVRPDPVDPADTEKLLITAEGRPLIHEHFTYRADGTVKGVSRSDALNQAVRRLMGKGKRKWVSFGTLRKTYRSAADECADLNAVNLTMGHQFPGMAQFYVRAIAEPRLKLIADHVRSKLLTSHKGSVRSGSRKPSASTGPGRRGAASAKTIGSRQRESGTADARRPRRSRKRAARKGKAS